MMISLKKAKKEFGIVFRGEGKELDQVVTEFNKFCLGEHPCYNGKNNTQLARFDGTKGQKNFIIPTSNLITLYRFNNELEGMQAVFGTLKRVYLLIFNQFKIKQTINRDFSESNIQEHYEEDPEVKNYTIEKSGKEIQLKINKLLKEKSSGIAISDDYEYFLKQQKDNEAGKPLLIDQTDYQTLQIFFDDEIDELYLFFKNVFAQENKVVQLLFKIMQQIKSFRLKKALISQFQTLFVQNNRYVVKVDIIQLIREPEYFIKAIEICEKARQDEIEKIEKGISDDGPAPPKKSDWQLLNELSDGDYLRKTVIPLLCPALQLIDIQRPTDPVSFIAVYLLKNKEKISLPKPPQEINEQKQENNEKISEDDQQQQQQQPEIEKGQAPIKN